MAAAGAGIVTGLMNTTIISGDVVTIIDSITHQAINIPVNELVKKAELKDFISRDKYQHDMETLKASINAHLAGDNKHDEHINALIDKKMSQNNSNKQARLAIWISIVSALGTLVGSFISYLALT